MFLAGPGVPHWGRITKYPLKFITIFFLPSVVGEMGPQSDGPRILSRFTARQSELDRIYLAILPHGDRLACSVRP